MATITRTNAEWVSHSKNTRIKVKDMVDEYLLNTIAMLERGEDCSGRRIPMESYNLLPALRAELAYRGLEAVEAGWDR